MGFFFNSFDPRKLSSQMRRQLIVQCQTLCAVLSRVHNELPTECHVLSLNYKDLQLPILETNTLCLENSRPNTDLGGGSMQI